ncbi:MAG: hypothetical protein JW983_06080 [Elusimicrobia bacterium]|nr:hypothetical protein [Elusimicrobiota bacterium]
MNKNKTVFVILSTFLLSVVLFLVLIVFAIQKLSNKYILKVVNNELPKILKKEVSVKDAHISVLSLTLRLKGFYLQDTGAGVKDVMLNVNEIRIKANIVKVLKGTFSIKEILFTKPKINIACLSKVKDIVTVPANSEYLSGIDIESIIVEDGILTTNLLDDKAFIPLGDISASISSIKKLPLEMKIVGVLPAKRKGALDLELKFQSFKKLNFEGKFKLKNIYTPYFNSLLGAENDIKINGGEVDVKSNIHCSDDWLTVSNIISIDKLDLEVSQKKLYGIKSELITEFFRKNNVTFDLPISGNIRSLRFDFSTAATQIMLKALQEILEDPDDVTKYSEKLGRKIGSKMGKDLTKLLYPRSRVED